MHTIRSHKYFILISKHFLHCKSRIKVDRIKTKLIILFNPYCQNKTGLKLYQKLNKFDNESILTYSRFHHRIKDVTTTSSFLSRLLPFLHNEQKFNLCSSSVFTLTTNFHPVENEYTEFFVMRSKICIIEIRYQGTKF